LVIKTLPGNLSIGFMLRDKRHCLQVLRFERGNANGKQSNTIIAAQLCQSFHRRTVPTENKKIHNSGIYLVENYFLHGSPLFSFSNSRSAKSKT